MSRSVKATEKETSSGNPVTFRLLQARHRAKLRTLAKSRGLSINTQAREIVEGSLDRSDENDTEREMLRLEVQELRRTVERMERGLVMVLTGLVALTPNRNGERLTATEAREYVTAAFSEKGE